MPGVRVDGNDVLAVRAAAAEAVSRARAGGGPSLIECMTWRYYGHFLGDRALYKDPEEDKAWHDRDPIPAFERRLLGEGLAAPSELEQIKAEAEREIREAVEFARDSPYPADTVMFEDLYV
jgi:pyruvate dehydrogenase E1 component alpha subunit